MREPVPRGPRVPNSRGDGGRSQYGAETATAGVPGACSGTRCWARPATGSDEATSAPAVQSPIAAVRIVAKPAVPPQSADGPVPQQLVGQAALAHASTGWTTPNSAAINASVTNSLRTTDTASGESFNEKLTPNFRHPGGRVNFSPCTGSQVLGFAVHLPRREGPSRIPPSERWILT